MRRSLSVISAGLTVCLSIGVLTAPGSLFSASAADEPQSPSVETGFVPELSSARSSTYRQEDGSYLMEGFTEAVNYRDESGELKPIDTTLVEASGSTYDVETAASSVVVKIPEDPSSDPVKVSDDEAWVSMRLHDSGEDPAQVEGATATFTDVADADAVTYEAIAEGVKESIILDSTPATAPSFTYDLDASAGLRPVTQPDGDIWLLDNNDRMKFVVPAAFMTDSTVGESASTGQVSMDIHATGDHWTLTLTPDYAWLSDPARAYPVVIDPTVVNKDASYDCWISQGNPDDSMCGGGADHIRVGVAVSDNKKRRSLLNFDVSTIPTGAKVVSATANLYLDSSYSSNSQSADYGLHTPSKGWNNSATWNTSGANGSWTGGGPGATTYSSRSINGSTDGYKAFTGLEDLIQGWVDTTIASRGMVLKQESESVTNVIGFYSKAGPSGKKPYLTITYTIPPTVPDLAVTPCLDDCDPDYTLTGSLTPTLKATSTDADDSTLTYTWKLREEYTTTVLATTTTTATQGTQTSWALPSGTLDSEKTYEWQVVVTDGGPNGSASSSTDWTLLGVYINDPPDTPADLGLSPCLDDDCSTLTTTSTTPQLTATAVDPEDFAIETRFEVRIQGTTTVIASGDDYAVEGGPTFFQVPDGVLGDGDEFEFRAGARDDNHGTGYIWSPWTGATVDLPSGPLPPTDLALTTCTGTCTDWVSSTTKPSFTATRPSGAGSGDLAFEITDGAAYTTSGTATNIAPQAVGTWTVPAGELGPNSYLVRVGTVSGAQTNWTAWQPVTIDPEATDGADVPASEEGIEDPNETAVPDTSSDTDDTGPTSTFGDSDLAAIDAQVETDNANAATDGMGENDPDLAPRSVSIPKKFAPVISIHPDESYDPLSPGTFVKYSELYWKSGGTCLNYHIKKKSDNAWSLGHGVYEHKATNVSTRPQACYLIGDPYQSSLFLRPGDKNNTVPNKQGMYLNLKNSKRDGDGFNGSEPIYYDYKPYRYLIYWMPWGFSYETVGPTRWGTHEGDWERIAIKLNKHNNPTWVQYFYHYDRCRLKWSKAPKYTGKHVWVWAAKGAHGNYPAYADPKDYYGGVYEDNIEAGGDTWYANGQNVLRNVLDQDWYGYGGAWGTPALGLGSQWGPVGPNYYHQYTPPGFKGPRCEKKNGSY